MTAPETKDCPQCSANSSNNSLDQAEQLMINWDKVKSRYSFSALPREDQAEILGQLSADDHETFAEKARRLHLKPTKKYLDPNENSKAAVQERLGDKVAAATGMGGMRVKLGAKKFMIQYKKKW